MSSLLDRFKPTKVSGMKKQQEAVEKVMPTTFSRPGYLDITSGTNVFRIFPPHPGSAFFAFPRATSYLPFFEKDEDGKKKEKGKHVFNLKMHFDKSLKDPVEEYMTFAKAILPQEIQDKAELELKLKALTFWQTSPAARLKWVMYAKKIEANGSKFGRLEISNKQKEELNLLCIANDQQGQPIETDPFTDPIEGKALQIIYNKEAKQGKDKYKLSVEFRNNYALTEEELEEYIKQEPLEKIFVNCYTRKDFDLAVEGLANYDKKHNLGIFEYSDFIEILEEIGKYDFPENRDEIRNNSSNESEDPDEEVNEEPIVQDEFDLMIRAELKAFIKTNGIEGKIFKKTTDDELRERIREFMNREEEEEEETEEETSEQYPRSKDSIVKESKQAEKIDKEKSDLPWDKEQVTQSPKDRLKNLKNQLGKK